MVVTTSDGTRIGGDCFGAKQKANGRSDATIECCFFARHSPRALAGLADARKILGSGCGRKKGLHIFLLKSHCLEDVNGSLGVTTGYVERSRF